LLLPIDQMDALHHFQILRSNIELNSQYSITVKYIDKKILVAPISKEPETLPQSFWSESYIWKDIKQYVQTICLSDLEINVPIYLVWLLADGFNIEMYNCFMNEEAISKFKSYCHSWILPISGKIVYSNILDISN
jgi:hypothetical protein